MSASSPPFPQNILKIDGVAEQPRGKGQAGPKVPLRQLEFVFSWSALFPAGEIGKLSLTHCLHELLIVLVPVNFPGAVECHGCACRGAALQGPAFAQGIYGLPYLEGNSQDDVAE